MNINDIENYIYNNSLYPFKDSYNFLIVNTTNNDILLGFKEVLLDSYTLKIDDDNTLIFYYDSFDSSIKELIGLINDDFGENLKINVGFKIYKDISGENILNYYSFIKDFFKTTNKNYTSFISLVCLQDLANKQKYLSLIKNNVIDRLLKDERNKEFINIYFKNNLNVLKTSKDIYISRSSVIFRIKSIKKNFGIDLQVLEDICGLYYLLN